MNPRFRHLLLPAMVLAACGRPDAQDQPVPPPPAAPAGPSGAPGMGGMQGTGGGTLEQMQAHLGSMRGAGGDSLKAMLPTHRPMTANMIAEMNREMRQMNMPADPAWTATVDSLRQDLVRMPEMSPAELQGAMPAHEARIERLMQMHRSMMRGGRE